MPDERPEVDAPTAQQALDCLRDENVTELHTQIFTFTDDEWNTFCSLLSTNRRIDNITLDLRSGSLSVLSRVESLARALNGNTTIRQLALSARGRYLPVEALHRVIPTLSNLDRLISYNIGMTTQGAIALSEALVNNTSIDYLHISDNPSIGDEGCLAIIKALCGHPKLRELNMGNTGVTDDTVEALVTDLLPSGGLERLDLDFNRGIGNRGALALAKALRDDGGGNGVKIKRVWLRNCGITELHREWLQCPKGMRVDVYGNPIQTRLSVELASAFLSHDVIRGLHRCDEFVQANNIPREYRHSSYDALRYITLAGDSHTQLSRGRIVLIGDYGQGKSWLARNMSAERDWFRQWSPQSPPPDLPSTQAMASFEVDVNNSTILVQDLGGQEVYRTVQSLLLHGSPLYLYCVSLANFDSGGDQQFTQRLQLWLDTLASSHTNEVTPVRVMLVATHADTIDDETQLMAQLVHVTSLFNEALKRRAEGKKNEQSTPLILHDTSWAVDNRETFRCWLLTRTGEFKSHDFPTFTLIVCHTTMDCARRRYAPYTVPERWVALYTLIKSKPGLLLEWKELEQEASKLTPPINSTDELEFVLRLVREWTGIVHFRRPPSRHDRSAPEEIETTLAQQYIFLRPDWFVKVASSLFIIHHHFSHDHSSGIRAKYNVTIHSNFDGDFESDSRQAPPLPAGVTLARLDNEGLLHPLITESTMDRELLVKLTQSARDELGIRDDNTAMDLLLATLEELDILIRVKDSTTERYLCPSLASTISANPSGMIDEHVRRICESGLHREYRLPHSVPREIFFRIIAKMCRALQGVSGFETAPVNLGYERALWQELLVRQPGLTHTLLLCWEQGVSPDSSSLQVWTTGETAQSHPFLDCLESVLTSTATLFPDKELDHPVFRCPDAACRGRLERIGRCRKCLTVHELGAVRYGPHETTHAGPTPCPSTLKPGFVFICYKWNPTGQPVTAKWVQEQFIPRLRQEVGSREIVCDIDHASVQAQTVETKNEWMARMIREAAIVLVICSPGYLKSTKVRSGVRFEYVQILDRLHDPDQPVLPILPEGVAFEESVPLPLRAAAIALQYPKQSDELVSLLRC